MQKICSSDNVNEVLAVNLWAFRKKLIEKIRLCDDNRKNLIGNKVATPIKSFPTNTNFSKSFSQTKFLSTLAIVFFWSKLSLNKRNRTVLSEILCSHVVAIKCKALLPLTNKLSATKDAWKQFIACLGANNTHHN